MKTNNTVPKEMYGISRIDCERYNSHAWRVSLSRQGKRYVKNFPDKKCGGKKKALCKATKFRDQFMLKYPPITRREFCNTKRRNNKTGITGVYKYRKTYQLKDGTIKESWYWEANWPDSMGESICKSFAINRFGEDLAKQMAITAREEGLQTVEGIFWAAERGEIQPSSDAANIRIHEANPTPLDLLFPTGTKLGDRKINLTDATHHR